MMISSISQLFKLLVTVTTLTTLLCTTTSAFVIPATTSTSRSFITSTSYSSSSSACTAAVTAAASASSLRMSKAEDEGENSGSPEQGQEQRGGFLPFFARRFNNKFSRKEDEKQDEAAAVSSSTSTILVGEEASTPPQTTSTSTAPTPTVTTTTSTVTAPLSPEQQARRLRAEAERMRLEAERMDAELTLQKIAKLEEKLQSSSKKKRQGEVSQEDMDAMQQQLQVLQTKLLLMTSSDSSSNDKNKNSSSASSSTLKLAASSSSVDAVPGGELKTLLEQQRQAYLKDTEDLVQLLSKSPSYIKKIMAAAVKLEYNETAAEQMDLTELALRLEGLQSLAPNSKEPVFTKEQIRRRAKELTDNPQAVKQLLPYFEGGKDEMVEDLTKNVTRLALLSLEYDYYFPSDEEDKMKERLVQSFDEIMQQGEGEQWMFEVWNKSAADATIESLYPKCMTQGPEPTLAQVQQLVADIRAVFPTTKQPEKVLGGYILRGQSKKPSGDELLLEIDAILAKKPGPPKVSVFYTQDFSIFLDPDAFETYDPEDVPPILYVTGPDVLPPPRRLGKVLASAAGLATCWYLSIYPFLLNPVIASRVEEELALADTGMTPDLAWLSELSLPLFFVFVGIQLIGEMGHQAVAAANKVKLSVPTFVPSLITGITSTVTTFKTPPPTKTAMFDISVAGPLVGILASLLAIVVGSALTNAASDASLLPALPLEILRQSTLGGGIINSIVGNGVLSVPVGAEGTAAVAGITIPLHPVAVAGYISLIVNALSLLPVGTTDGGRMALGIFGRGAKLLVGNLSLLALLVVGFLGSDLFLFYFGFLVLFQSGNEIAARNEVDKVDFSRVIVAIVAYVLMLLTLIPFQ